MRPAPAVPHASSPTPGAITVTPRAASADRFSRVAAASHIPAFIAGATKSRARVASSVSVSR